MATIVDYADMDLFAHCDVTPDGIEWANLPAVFAAISEASEPKSGIDVADIRIGVEGGRTRAKALVAIHKGHSVADLIAIKNTLREAAQKAVDACR